MFTAIASATAAATMAPERTLQTKGRADGVAKDVRKRKKHIFRKDSVSGSRNTGQLP